MKRLNHPALARGVPGALGAGFVTLLVAGCAGQGNVSGKVTFQGKAVPFGTVLFVGSDGNARQGNLDRDGNYTVLGVTTGDAQVAVNSPNPKGITLVYKDPAKKPKPYPDVPGWFAIPGKYESPTTSGLVYTIQRGENKIDIELVK